MTEPLPLAITMGDPSGIGIEITAKAWIARVAKKIPPFFLVGDKSVIDNALGSLFDPLPTKLISAPAEALDIFQSYLPVYDPNEEGDVPHQTLAAIRSAVSLCLQNKAAAVVTNPIQKKRLYDAGFQHPGHTEYLAELTDAPGKAIMMFACNALKVVPATIHIAVTDISKTLTRPLLERAFRTTASDLTTRFGIKSPTIVVAGLNPHAGEEGSIGREEVELIKPVIQSLANEGIDIRGPFPADSLFHPAALQKFDAAICMYHDQALIPIKTIDFDNGVNVTLGLPIIRTSPDHGTAEDIAGKGIANPASLIAAILMAEEMASYSKAVT